MNFQMYTYRWGLGQINAAWRSFKELGKDGISDLLSLAKKRDEEDINMRECAIYFFKRSGSIENISKS